MSNELTARKAIKGWLGSNEKTQQWLAARIGISQPTLSNILNDYAPASDDVANDIKRITGIDIRKFDKVA